MEKYEVLGQVGEGSFGQVYKAKKRCDGEIVAFKVIRKVIKTSIYNCAYIFFKIIIYLHNLKIMLVILKCIETFEFFKISMQSQICTH